MTANTPVISGDSRIVRTLRAGLGLCGLTTALALAACQKPPEPSPPPVSTPVRDAGTPRVSARDAAPIPVDAADGPTGTLEGTVTLTGPIPQAQPITLDAATARRAGCTESAREFYARPFGLASPGVMPAALVTVDARSRNPPPPRRRYANFYDCHIEPRLLVMSLNDELRMHAETSQHHFPKVDGMGATIAQLLQRTEDQVKQLQRPGRYILHSVNYPNWLQTPLLVTPNWFYDQSDPSGHYRIEHVPVGTYPVHAWFPGTTTADGTVTIRANETTRQDFALTPLPPSQVRPPQPPPVDAGPIIP
jgi:hypothetical protein